MLALTAEASGASVVTIALVEAHSAKKIVDAFIQSE
jgi:hypothetical protein